MDHNHKSCCHEPDNAPPPKPWYLKSFALITYIILFGIILSYFWHPLHAFRHTVFEYGKILVIPVLLGFVLGGMIDRYIPGEYISKRLSKRHWSTILNAAGLGFLMSACNHGILALTMALHKKGASSPALITFLLASPWANLTMTFLLVSFFGWYGVMIILLALVVALITGFIFLLLERLGWIEKNQHTLEIDASFKIREDIRNRFRQKVWSAAEVKKDVIAVAHGGWSLVDMVMPWIMLGVLLAGLAAAFVPQNIFHNFLGPSALGLIVTLVVATLLEVCSEGTSPLAFELYRQTGALGNAFVFLMAGVVTDYTEIGLIWKNVGRRTALWMLAVSLPQVIIIGILLNRAGF